jgi:hypothetical protein
MMIPASNARLYVTNRSGACSMGAMVVKQVFDGNTLISWTTGRCLVHNEPNISGINRTLRQAPGRDITDPVPVPRLHYSNVAECPQTTSTATNE